MNTKIRRVVVMFSIILFVISVGEIGLRIYRSFFSIGGREDPAAFHLYIIGGSSAEGVPYEPLSFGVMVSSMFEGTFYGRPIEVHNLAASGDTIYTQWVRFIRAVRGRDRDVPGAMLVYSGHNDTGDILESGEVPWGTRVERGLCRRSRLVLEGVYGIRRLLERSAAAGQDSYGYYLREVMDTALAAGLTPFVSTVVSNISDIEPNYQTDDPDGVRIAMESAAPFEEAGRCDAAQTALTEGLPEGNGRDAFQAYRFAHCLRRQGRYRPAREAYLRAVDSDPRVPFGRATRRQNEIVVRVAGDRGVPVVDSVDNFVRSSTNGLIGRELFSDAQHPNLAGHLLLAVGFAEAMSKQLGEPIRRRFKGAAEVRAEFPREDPAFPYLHGGTWLLATSFRHPWPMDRLRAAEQRFRSALEHDPHSFTGWMGLGLALAGQSSSLLHRPEVMEQIDRWGGFTYHGYLVPEGELDELLDLLRTSGVDADVLTEVEASHPDRRPEPRE